MEVSTQNSGNSEVTATGQIYLELENSEKHLLDKLDSLKSLHVFIIQRKAEVNYFSSNVSYEIMDTRRNLIYRASKPKSFFSSKKSCKVSVRNFRNVKLLDTIVEPTNNFYSSGTEASVYVHPGKRVAHIEKYGGVVGPPSYEIFNVDRKTAFTIDHNAKSDSTSSMLLDYDVSTKRGVVANIMMKTGLNFVLSTNPGLTTLEKATLIGVILAMDLLKTGTREQSQKEPSGNQYLLR